MALVGVLPFLQNQLAQTSSHQSNKQRILILPSYFLQRTTTTMRFSTIIIGTTISTIASTVFASNSKSSKAAKAKVTKAKVTKADDYQQVLVPCTVDNTTATVHMDYTCGEIPTKDTLIYYPTGGAVTGNYPVVFMHRGSSGYKDESDGGLRENGYLKWAKKIAGQCVIVVLPQTLKGYQDETLCKRDYDLKIAYDWATSGSNLSNKIGGRPVNLDRIALMGHSAGAHHIPKAISYYNIPNVEAIIFSHGGKDLPANQAESWPGWWPGDYSIPTMMLTASNDTKVNPSDVWNWYESNKARGITKSNAYHTVFVSSSGDHLEPIETGYFSTWMGRFLACHLYPRGSERKATTCKRFYGNSADICDDIHLQRGNLSTACDRHGSTLV